MKATKGIHRCLIYLMILILIPTFSVILGLAFAREVIVAYICTALNGVIALESFFLLNHLDGKMFFKIFWPVYLVRLGLLVMFVFTYALLNKGILVSFFLSFLVYYFTWMFSEIYILMKVAEKK